MFNSQELLVLIEAIYAGILDPAAWEAALVGLCRAFGGAGAALNLQGAASEETESLTLVGIDESYRHTYAELTRLPDMVNAFRAVAENAALGALTAEEMALAAPDYDKSRFYAEWLRPQRTLDLIAAPLMPGPGIVGGFFVGRLGPPGQYGDLELGVLRLLRPHLLRAVQVRRRLNGFVAVARDALAALDLIDQGVVLVDAGAGITHANRAAEAALGRKDGLGATCSVLACDHADDTATLRRLVGEASARTPLRPAGPLAVRRRSGRRPLSVLVAPLRGEPPVPTGRSVTAIVLIADPEAAVPEAGAALRATYGLTAAEARVAAALLKHERLADVAASLGVSVHTVRTLLQRAFDKTDTHRQAELVRLMLAHRVSGGGATPAPASSARTSPAP
ncbi:MAG: helix-turn-helix transcriptional regulator [Geminicoccaceae bacterium]